MGALAGAAAGCPGRPREAVGDAGPVTTDGGSPRPGIGRRSTTPACPRWSHGAGRDV